MLEQAPAQMDWQPATTGCRDPHVVGVNRRADGSENGNNRGLMDCPSSQIRGKAMMVRIMRILVKTFVQLR